MIEPAAAEDENAIEDAPIWARMKQVAPALDAAADAPGEMMDQCRICPRVLVEALKGCAIHQQLATINLASGYYKKCKISFVLMRMYLINIILCNRFASLR